MALCHPEIPLPMECLPFETCFPPHFLGTQQAVKLWRDTMTQITQSHHVAGLLWAHKLGRETETQIMQSTHVAGLQGTVGHGEVEGFRYHSKMQTCTCAHVLGRAGIPHAYPAGVLCFIPKKPHPGTLELLLLQHHRIYSHKTPTEGTQIFTLPPASENKPLQLCPLRLQPHRCSSWNPS